MDLSQLSIGDRVGQGGMGAVHRATWKSPAGGVPVAVKFVHGTRKMGADVAFLREARAAARLSHPNVVTLLDAGRVADPNGPGEPGIPYLVMEWVDGETLGVRPPTDWAETRGILRDLLLALGHAHGWGVLHRDIKPGNVMRTAEGVVRLMDFGVGRVLDDVADPDTGRRTRRVTGTPQYMAPEQVLGEWRDEGPWTDIYGLGALAWKLVSGEPPFVGEMEDVLVAQVRERPPRLSPRFEVPHAVRNWLYSMLEKRPRDRFRSAAEALAALDAMDGGERTSRYPVVTPGRASANVATKLAVPKRYANDDLPVSSELRAAGAGLFGMREPPIVGRETEKEQLWNALRRVSRLERAELGVLSGPGGSGKTALARWLVRRANEGGYAAVLHSTHDSGVAGASALSGAVMRWFRVEGLGVEDALERMAAGLESLGFEGARQLAIDIIARRWPSSTERRGLHEAAEWRRFLVEFAERVGHGAPVIWVLDDIHLSAATQEFVRFAGDAECALLLVATTRDAGTLGVRRSFEMPLSRQSDSAIRELIQSMLPLDPLLTDTLVQLADGSPVFATQLLGDWVARDLLEPGALGYKSSADVTRIVPSDVKNLWFQRVDSALHGQKDAARDALRLLAVMGERVPIDLWRRGCALLDIADPDPILEALAPSGLIRLEAEEIRLSPGLLRESLLEEDGLRAHHLAAAQALVSEAHSPRDAERAARSLWAAGEQLPALDQLYDAILRYYRAEERDALMFVVPLLQEWAEVAGEQDNICLGDALLMLYGIVLERASVEDAAVPLEACAAIVFRTKTAAELVAEPDGLRNSVAAGVQIGRARMFMQSDPRRALALFREGQALAAAVGNAGEAISAATFQADVLSELGEVDEALEVLEAALTGVAAGTVDWRTSVAANLQSAELFELRGEYDRAIAALERAEERARAIGSTREIAFANSRRGDMLAFAGRLEEAQEAARVAAELYASCGNWIEGVCRMNVLLFDVLAGRARSNREVAHHIVVEFEQPPLDRFNAVAVLIAAVCECASGDSERAQRLYDRAVSACGDQVIREIVMLTVALAEHAEGGLRDAALSFAHQHAGRLPAVYGQRLAAIA